MEITTTRHATQSARFKYLPFRSDFHGMIWLAPGRAKLDALIWRCAPFG